MLPLVIVVAHGLNYLHVATCMPNLYFNLSFVTYMWQNACLVVLQLVFSLIFLWYTSFIVCYLLLLSDFYIMQCKNILSWMYSMPFLAIKIIIEVSYEFTLVHEKVENMYLQRIASLWTWHFKSLFIIGVIHNWSIKRPDHKNIPTLEGLHQVSKC